MTITEQSGQTNRPRPLDPAEWATRFRLDGQVAVVRPRMLRLAAERVDGAMSAFLPLSGVERVRSELGQGPELACRVFAFLGDEEQGWPRPAGCSPPTARRRITRPSTGGSAWATRSAPW